jgi:hypothetical protein
MRPSKHAITFSELASIYQITKQGAAWLVARHGYDAVCVPDLLFREMLGSRATPLRSRLACPEFRKTAQRYLHTAAFRCAIKPRDIRSTTATPKPKS